MHLVGMLEAPQCPWRVKRWSCWVLLPPSERSAWRRAAAAAGQADRRRCPWCTPGPLPARRVRVAAGAGSRASPPAAPRQRAASADAAAPRQPQALVSTLRGFQGQRAAGPGGHSPAPSIVFSRAPAPPDAPSARATPLRLPLPCVPCGGARAHLRARATGACLSPAQPAHCFLHARAQSPQPLRAGPPHPPQSLAPRTAARQARPQATPNLLPAAPAVHCTCPPADAMAPIQAGQRAAVCEPNVCT